MSPFWSYALGALGIFGLWLAGKGDWRGWAVGLGAQFAWMAYAIATHQWGFIFTAVAYGLVYGKNALRWLREDVTDGE